MKKAIVIGGGFAGLAGAAHLARDGWKVTLLERNQEIGGRARLWNEGGYTFDMGPSWYLMPEVFERFFSSFGRRREDYYTLDRLDPAYRVFFEDQGQVDVPSDLEEVRRLFAELEDGGDLALDGYLAEAAYKYDTAMSDFLYRDYERITDFFDRRLMTEGLKLHVFRKLDRHVRRHFKDHRSRKILEYAMVFLGSSPTNAPALYSLMSHVDLKLGVWFPDGGMGAAALGIARLAEEQGVEIITGREVTRIVERGGRAAGVETAAASGTDAGSGAPPAETAFFEADVILNTGDYHWADSMLLEPRSRSYSKRYWDTRVVAPSMFLAYLGIKAPLPELAHHNLYFSRDWDAHFRTIFEKPSWPGNPCWYLSRITATSAGMAPEGRENLFLLVPVAPGLEDTEEVREGYFESSCAHVRNITGVDLSANLEVKRLFSHRDFSGDYRAFQGTALGLSHTLFQTAVFRPGRRSRKLPNLYHAGQYTHPGVGVPMVIIAAELAARAIEKGEGGRAS
jgi:phytoene desaturase